MISKNFFEGQRKKENLEKLLSIQFQTNGNSQIEALKFKSTFPKNQVYAAEKKLNYWIQFHKAKLKL